MNEVHVIAGRHPLEIEREGGRRPARTTADREGLDTLDVRPPNGTIARGGGARDAGQSGMRPAT